MAPEGEKNEGSPDAGRPKAGEAPKTGHDKADRTTASDDTAGALIDKSDETAQEFAERHGNTFITFEQAKSRGLIIQNDRGNWEPAPGYRWVDDPAKRPKHLRNWAVKKNEVDPRERARKKGLSFMTHSEAAGKDLIVRNAKSGNWEPAEGYEWVDYPKLSENWAVRKKRPEPLPEPVPEPEPIKKPQIKPKPRPKPKPTPKPPSKPGPRPGPRPGPKPAPTPRKAPEFKREKAFTMKQLQNQPDWFPKHIHITIDDGPRLHNNSFQTILATLDKHGVKATFFFIGVTIAHNYKKDPAGTRKLLRQLVDNGHQIGYHTVKHQNIEEPGKKRFDKETEEAIKADIQEFQRILDEALGYHYTLKVGRLPGGHGTFEPHIAQAFSEMGLQQPKYWHIDDWTDQVRNNTAAYVDEIIKKPQDYIILLHEATYTAQDLGQFLTELKKQKMAPVKPPAPIRPAPSPVAPPAPPSKPAPPPAPPPQIEGHDPDASYIRMKGYERYGEQMYDRFQDYPTHRETITTRAEDAPGRIPLKAGTRPNDGANTTGWVPIKTGNKLYWRAYYHLRDLNIEDPFKTHKRRSGDNYDDEKLEDMRQKARFHIVSFPASGFKLGYYPGSTLLKQEKGGNKQGWLDLDDDETEINPAAGITGTEIPWKYRKLDDADKDETVMVFNGTYHQQDTYYAIDRRRVYAGLIVDGKEVIKPHDEFATVAIYKDGTVKIGSYKNLPDKNNILYARQNNLMLLENSQIASGAEKNRPRRFQDNLVSSYLGIDSKGNLSYIWFTRTPPEVVAKTLQALGFRDVMLLDVHAVISARVVNPGGKNMGKKGQNGYELIPRTGIIGQHFQWSHASAYRGSPHDFFAITHRK